MPIPTPRDAVAQGKDNEMRITLLERRLATLATSSGRLGVTGQQINDWDDATAAGFYWSGADAANMPGSGSVLALGVVTAAVVQGDIPVFIQEVRRAGSAHNSLYTRYFSSSGSWTSWVGP